MRTLLFTLLVVVPSLALAQHWEVNGIEGTFGDANAACRAALKDAPVLEFAPPARKPEGEESPDRIFRECWAREKGGSSSDGGNPASKHTIAWFSPAKENEPDEKKEEKTAAGKEAQRGCTRETDFSWFPSLEKSSLNAAGKDVVPDMKPGSCLLGSQSAGGRLFSGSQKKVRADRLKKEAKPVGEHYFLKHKGLIIDPTFFQFFQVGDHPGLVFVGTEAQLVQAADKLLAQCGANPASNDSKSGLEFKAANFTDAKLCNAGATLELRESGFGEYKSTTCDAPKGK
ncbi:MAG: hypothetical protein Q8N26_31500 [Myxococcales bacterium]|nr:hypothetical protein [Myxococcales bacterium]